MKISKERIATFLFLCIGIRILLTYFIYWIEKNKQDFLRILMGIVGLIISFSFIYIYLFGSERADQQLEIWNDQDNKVWWNNFRVVHGIFYFLFAMYALTNTKGSYVFLGVDVSVGLLLWFSHHFLGLV